jgi:thiamine-monophosphate kinase
MNGGEDYELLFTVPLELHDLIEGVEDVHVIGHVCDKNLGMNLVTRDGQEFGLKAQGWNAFQ